MKSIKHVVSVSGGKDSAATLLLALERRARLRGEQIKLRSSRCRVGEDGARWPAAVVPERLHRAVGVLFGLRSVRIGEAA